MKATGIWKLVAAGAVVLSLGTAAMAADMGPVESRQACMKANGKMMGVMVPMFKGEKPADEAAACGGWANWWGDDTKPGVSTVETWAKEEIWTDMAGFEAAGMAYVKASEGVKAAADEAAFKAAFPALGASCQGCHEKFRRPKG